MRFGAMRKDDTHGGRQRIRHGFAFFPRIIEGQLRWLEHVTWVERLVEDPFGVDFWVACYWIDE